MCGDGLVVQVCRPLISERGWGVGLDFFLERAAFAATDCYAVFARFCFLSGIVVMTDRRKVLTSSEERKTEATSGRE